MLHSAENFKYHITTVYLSFQVSECSLDIVGPTSELQSTVWADAQGPTSSSFWQVHFPVF